MGLEHRPYIGTWTFNNRKLVQHTPDALVFVNGDTSVPGCPGCGGRIYLQQYITQVSVDAATDPAGASSQISMTVPLHSPDQFHRDAQFILRPGLEVHVYMRGYFPIQGQFRQVMPEQTGGIDISSMMTYPYYHVFHGVVTQVDHAYSGGFQDITMNCASMLHFWQYHNMSSNASAFGARPSNSKLKMSLVGHNFTGMTPFSIIYTLFHDTAGAAGGVAFALSDKTNVSAKSSVGSGNLFSLNIKYWEERFKTRMIHLRMHGASGQLFSTAQAMFLGRLKGRHVRQLLTDQWKIKTGQHNTNKYDILSAARTLNFTREVKDPITGEIVQYGVDVVESEVQADPSSPKNNGAPGMEVNVASMQAFVSDLGQWGQVNLFESTYESKLDIVNKVLEVTGWEFYQDVDGDFVFKPPMYNLDTRSSRIYTIEDIDIISVNFSEKEPDVTYVTCNGSQFKNLKGTGLENEWGVRGQYIDYRLVAQFGWRPGSFETSYYSNPRAMFFAAVSRLDVMNIGVNSASCAIPLRPELRPGYPVYIRYLDCFYYLPSFNHAMVYGGQCTTNLTLTGKRAKFYAPSSPMRQDRKDVPADRTLSLRKGHLDLWSQIDLSQTSWPKRALQVLGSDGFPKLQGFPNVVMALDPDNINPLFFLAGFDLEQIDNPRVLRNVLKMAESYGLISQEKDQNGQVTRIVLFEDRFRRQEIDPQGNQNRSTTTSPLPTESSAGRAYTFEELVSVSKKYARLAQQPSKKLEKDTELVNQKVEAINSKDAKLVELRKGTQDEKVTAKITKLETEIDQLKKEIADLTTGIASEQKILEESLIQDPDVALLREMIIAITPDLTGTEDFPQPSRTAALLDLLSDKKAVFTNGQQPGSYRYYSSAHPDAEMQGQRSINATEGEGGSEGAPTRLRQGRKVVQFLKEPQRPGPDGTLPEAELGVGLATRGLRILRPFGEEVLTTDQVHTLSFVRHDVDGSANQTTYDYDDSYEGLNEEHRATIVGKFRNVVQSNLDPSLTIEGQFGDTWEQLVAKWEGPSFPLRVDYRGNSLATDTFLWIDLLPEAKDDPERAAAVARKLLGEQLFISTGAFFRDQWLTVTAIEDKGEKASAAKKFGKMIQDAGFGKIQYKLGQKSKEPKKKTNSFYSPVFPVSDAGGFEVVGTYRYGRGLQIQPNSTLEQLSFQDPLQFADPQAVEDYLDALQGRTPSNLDLITAGNERVDVPRAQIVREEAEQQLIDSLRKNPALPDDLKAQLDNPNLTGAKLSNWIARNNDGILKLPVGNAAFTLGDLQVHVDKKVCTCRSNQADVLIEALSTERFVKVLPANVDTISQFSANLMVEKAAAWDRFRKAIGGQSRTQSGRALAAANSAAASVGNAIGALPSGTIADLEAEQEAIKQAALQGAAAGSRLAGGGTPSAEEEAAAQGNTPGRTALEAVFGKEATDDLIGER